MGGPGGVGMGGPDGDRGALLWDLGWGGDADASPLRAYARITVIGLTRVGVSAYTQRGAGSHSLRGEDGLTRRGSDVRARKGVEATERDA